VCCGLPRYLSTPRWKNRWGEEISLDEIVGRLVERKLGSGACLGAHVPMALAIVSSLNQQARPRLISPQTEERVHARLKEISGLLTRTQGADGSWGLDWHDPGARQAGLPQSYLRGDNGKMVATGHHLEWMTQCPPELRPRDEVLAMAATYLARTLPGLTPEIEADFHVFAPATHAVRALLNVRGVRWAEPEWLADQPQSP
jgi:hypothetical protein